MLVLYRVLIQLIVCVHCECTVVSFATTKYCQSVFSRVYTIECKEVHHLSGNYAYFVETAIGNSYKMLFTYY